MILGGSKMKLKNLIKIAPIVVMVFVLSTQARGDEQMKMAIRHLETTEVTYDYPIVAAMLKAAGIDLSTELMSATINNLEIWMFNEEYLEMNELTDMVEAWMLESGYLEAESQLVEEWMLEDSYLDQSLVHPVESWMTDPGYLSK